MPQLLTQAGLHEIDPEYQPGQRLEAYTWDLRSEVHAPYIHEIFLYMARQKGRERDVLPAVHRGVAR
jgi:hypothetical protein